MKINELKAVVDCGREYPQGRQLATERVCNDEQVDTASTSEILALWF
jgi:hypothetical protein